MDGMESLLGQPVNAMASFMGSSKLDRSEDVGGLNQFDQYPAFGNQGLSMGDNAMGMLGNMPLNDIGLSSGSVTNGSGNGLNEARSDNNSMNNMVMNPLSTPISNDDMNMNPMGSHVDSLGLGGSEGMPGAGSVLGNGMSAPDVPGSMAPGGAGAGARGSGIPLGNMNGMLGPRGGNAGMGSMDSGSMDPSSMMNHMGPMNMANGGAQFNNQVQGVQGNGPAPGNAAGRGFPQNMAAQQMHGMPMHMDNGGGMFPMGMQVGMRPNMNQPQYMNGGSPGMIPPQLIDQQQVASALSAKRGSTTASRKKSQPRPQAAKKAAQPRGPRGSKAQASKAPGGGNAPPEQINVGAPSAASATPHQAPMHHPSVQYHQPPTPQMQHMQQMQHMSQPRPQQPQDLLAHRVQQSPKINPGRPSPHPPQPHSGFVSDQANSPIPPPASAGGTVPSNKLPTRQFEFSTQQPPPPRAPGALRLRIQFVLTLNQELIKISMSSASRSDVFLASMSRLESNLHYLNQVHAQPDAASALSVSPPILGPITAIPSLSDPYRRLQDMFKFRTLSNS